ALGAVVLTSEAALEPEAVAEAAPEAPAEAPEPEIAEATPGEPADAELVKQFTVAPGDTFLKLLQRAAISPAEAHQAVSVMRELFNPRDLRPGQTITTTFESTGQDGADRR